MTNEAYDRLKMISLLILPAVTFMAALVDIWGIPYGQQIVATLAAIDTLAGTVVAILSANYHRGEKEENADG